jgi:hypothetical protein
MSTLPLVTASLILGLYGISPCMEATARMKAADVHATPFSSWGVEEQVKNMLREKGLLLEHKKDSALGDDGLPF